MPASKKDEVWVSCPACGHRQAEPASAISSCCKKCGQYLPVQEILHPPQKAAEPRALKQRLVACFDCGAEQEVPVSAQSTMCRRCSHYIDLSDYRIASTVSRNFKTKGVFVVEPKGCVFNAEALVGEAVIKGKFRGKLAVERCLTICGGAEIKGIFTAARLVIPGGTIFGWHEPIRAGSVEVVGELVAGIQAAEMVLLRSTGRLFGDVSARSLVVEEGAVLVGRAEVRRQPGDGE